MKDKKLELNCSNSLKSMFLKPIQAIIQINVK